MQGEGDGKSLAKRKSSGENRGFAAADVCRGRGGGKRLAKAVGGTWQLHMFVKRHHKTWGAGSRLRRSFPRRKMP